MRHQAKSEQMTRLLLQKPQAYAEIAENSRIALTILGDDGWKIERVEMDLQVRVSTTTTIEQIDENAQLAERLRVAEWDLAAVRRAAAHKLRLSAANSWLLAGSAAAIATGFGLVGSQWWAVAVIGLCGFVALSMRVGARIKNNMKGAA
jgi:hypothetical protein